MPCLLLAPWAQGFKVHASLPQLNAVNRRDRHGGSTHSVEQQVCAVVEDSRDTKDRTLSQTGAAGRRKDFSEKDEPGLAPGLSCLLVHSKVLSIFWVFDECWDFFILECIISNFLRFLYFVCLSVAVGCLYAVQGCIAEIVVIKKLNGQ